MIVDDPDAIAQVYQSEVRDPRKRRWRPPRSEWIEFDDLRTGRRRRCRKWEREFETRERGTVRSIDPAAWHPGFPSGLNLLSRGHTADSTDAPWVPPGADNDVLRERMGCWLGSLADWTQFATWTFSRPVSVAGASDLGRKHLDWLCRWDVDNERGLAAGDERTRRRDERTRQKAASKRLQAFLATEKGETGGLLHLHALVARITTLPAFCGVILPPGEWGWKCCMTHGWPCGYARVLPYDPALGAKHYVSKYVTKGYLSEWELLGNFKCRGKACSSALH